MLLKRELREFEFLPKDRLAAQRHYAVVASELSGPSVEIKVWRGDGLCGYPPRRRRRTRSPRTTSSWKREQSLRGVRGRLKLWWRLVVDLQIDEPEDDRPALLGLEHR